MKRKVTLVLLTSAILIGVLFTYFSLPCAALEKPVPPTAVLGYVNNYLLYCVEEDAVLAERNADLKISASVSAKMMLALATIRAVNESETLSLDMTVTVSDTAASGNRLTPSLKVGEELTLRALLSAVILRGAEDAAAALSAVTAGSREAMTSLMNALAAELGMTDTVYLSPASEDSQTTARDVLTLAKVVLRNTVYTDIAAKARVIIPATNLSDARTVYSANHMLSTYIFPSGERLGYDYYTPGVTGLAANDRNTGAQSGGGNGGTVVACTRIGELTYLCVAMGGKATDNYNLLHFRAAKTLLSWGAEAYEYKSLSKNMVIAGELSVKYGDGRDYVTLSSAGVLRLFLPSSVDMEQVEYEFVYESNGKTSDKPPVLTAPVEAGERVGVVLVKLHGEVIGELPLVTKYRVGYSASAYVKENMKKIFLGPVAVTLYVLIVLGTAGLILAGARYRYLHRPKITVRTTPSGR